jgi:hypothetical protein
VSHFLRGLVQVHWTLSGCRQARHAITSVPAGDIIPTHSLAFYGITCILMTASPLHAPAGSYMNAVNNMLRWRDANTPSIPVWVTEWGWDAARDWLGEKCAMSECVTSHEQAVYAVRGLLLMARKQVLLSARHMAARGIPVIGCCAHTVPQTRHAQTHCIEGLTECGWTPGMVAVSRPLAAAHVHIMAPATLFGSVQAGTLAALLPPLHSTASLRFGWPWLGTCSTGMCTIDYGTIGLLLLLCTAPVPTVCLWPRVGGSAGRV